MKRKSQLIHILVDEQTRTAFGECLYLDMKTLTIDLLNAIIFDYFDTMHIHFVIMIKQFTNNM